ILSKRFAIRAHNQFEISAVWSWKFPDLADKLWLSHPPHFAAGFQKTAMLIPSHQKALLAVLRVFPSPGREREELPQPYPPHVRPLLENWRLQVLSKT